MFGAIPLPRTLEAALRDLGAEKAEVRAASARDLVAHARRDGGPGPSDARERIVRALQKALKQDANAQVRAVAATALADVDADEALPELLLAVEDDNALVRQMAIAALGEIGDPRATERLRRALGDERAEVRFQAVMAFPRVSTSREASIEALLRATHDADAFVCHIALRMTDELRGAHDGDGEEGTAAPDPSPPDPRVLARARALLGHPSAEVRVAGAVVLGAAGAVDVASDAHGVHAILVDVALGALRTRDREDEAAAIELCGELGLSAARPGLERRAFGGLLGLRRDALAWHARVALARMGHERACREILRELGDRDRDVCALAVAAAGRGRILAARERLVAMRGDGRVDPSAVDEALAALAASPITATAGALVVEIDRDGPAASPRA